MPTPIDPRTLRDAVSTLADDVMLTPEARESIAAAGGHIAKRDQHGLYVVTVPPGKSAALPNSDDVKLRPADRKAANETIAYIDEHQPRDPRWRWSSFVDGDSLRVVAAGPAGKYTSIKIAIAQLVDARFRDGMLDDILGALARSAEGP